MRRVSRVGMTDGRKPNRASPRRRGSLPVLLTSTRTSEMSPPDTRTLVGGAGDITVCKFPANYQVRTRTGAFVFFSSPRNGALPGSSSATRTGARPVDLEGNLRPERSDPRTSRIGRTREGSGEKRSTE